MVIEAKSIKGSLKGLKYQSDDKGKAIEVCRNGLIGNDPKDWNTQMMKSEANNSRVENKRISIVIAPSKEVSKNLNLETAQKLVDFYFEKMGISSEDYQYIAHMHTSTDDPHIHLTLSRISYLSDIKKNAINDNNIGTKAGSIADKIAKENGWKTAKEISAAKKNIIGDSLRITLRTATNFEHLKSIMKTHGFEIQLAENESKGIYGMRIVPIVDINIQQSERAARSKQGYKLSEIEKFVDRKAKFKIADIHKALERNYFKTLTPMEKIAYAENKRESLIGDIIEKDLTKIVNQSENTNDPKPSKGVVATFIDEALKNTPQNKSDDELTRKRKKRKGR